MLKGGVHKNAHLQAAWSKYGESAFTFTVIIRCEKSECLAAEQKEIDSRKPFLREFGYNVCPTAGSQLGTKRSQEVKDKFKRIRLSEAKIRRGVKMSPDQRILLSKMVKDRSAGVTPYRRARATDSISEVPEDLINRSPNRGVSRGVFAFRAKSENHKKAIGDTHKRLWTEKRAEMLTNMKAALLRQSPEKRAEINRRQSELRAKYWSEWRASRGIKHSAREIDALNRERAKNNLPAYCYEYARFSLDHPLALATISQVKELQSTD